MSYNLRYDNPEDGENRWDLRKDRVVNLIRFHDTDFVGTQEGLLHQLRHIDEQAPELDWIGVGRDDGVEEGEFSAIFFNRNRYELVAESDSTIWLSETPGRPSKSWDADLPRILTFGQFRQLSTGKTFYVFNTHFDHIGVEARQQSARLIVETIREISGDLPVVVTGDFNVTPDSDPYQVMTGSRSPLQDAYNSSVLPHVGPEFTFSGFYLSDDPSERRIDYIFTNDAIEVSKHAILPYYRNGRYPSDHLPVLAEILLR
ncbi:MAG: endonuclease/exonuclease/phosphatase family protein [Balneolaceae bacterium]